MGCVSVACSSSFLMDSQDSSLSTCKTKNQKNALRMASMANNSIVSTLNCKNKQKLSFLSLTSVYSTPPQQLTHLAEVLPHDLNKIWHWEIHDVVPPSSLQHHIRAQQVIAGKQASGKTFSLVLLQKPRQKLLRQLDVLGFRRVLHGILHRRSTQQFGKERRPFLQNVRKTLKYSEAECWEGTITL